MKRAVIIFLLGFLVNSVLGQTQTIHVFVALCDNENQGIVPVPEKLGNGKDPYNNLYWGAAYGVKSYFKNKTSDWQLVSSPESGNENILERVLFKHATKDIYLLADAYDGEKIKDGIEDFLRASNGQSPIKIQHDSRTIEFGGGSDLLAFVGHDGLMDFDVSVNYNRSVSKVKDVMILACSSQYYFTPEIREAQARPLLWTTNLMAPEAYTLKYAIDGWIENETGEEIKERAASAYNKYQKCGMNGARRLFATGF